MRVGWRWVVGGLIAGAVCAGAPSRAEACSPLPPLPPVGLPRSGTTDVSTATSMIVFARGTPTGFKLLAGGQDVALAPPVELGGGADGASGGATFWQIRPDTSVGFLTASAEHVLSATFQGATTEVTRFTTAAGYDKTAGVAPLLNAVHLWRVRYPVADIASGNCVFAEYHGFITVDYVPGSVPNTAADSVVHAFRLAPKNGGSAQTFVYTGETPFAGLEPKGAYPTPIGLWQPELDPTRSYCLSISATGDGDIARLAVASQEICADVVQLSATGAPPPPGAAGGGGCAIAGSTDLARTWPFAFALAVAAVLRRRDRR